MITNKSAYRFKLISALLIGGIFTLSQLKCEGEIRKKETKGDSMKLEPHEIPAFLSRPPGTPVPKELYEGVVSALKAPVVPETFIITSYPLSVEAYWRLVIQNQITTGVQLSTKGVPYHLNVGESLQVDGYHIQATELQEISDEENRGYLRRKYKIIDLKTDEIRKFTHLFLEWPDLGLPNEKAFTAMVQDYQSLINNSQAPKTLIHCRAGVGRTGTFVFTRVMSCVEDKSDARSAEVLTYLRAMRPLIDTPEQLQFALKVAREIGSY